MATKFPAAIFLVVCCVIVTLVSGSAIDFTSSTDSIKPLVTNKLTLHCDLHDSTPTDIPGGSVVGRRRRDLHDSSNPLTHSDTHSDTHSSYASQFSTKGTEDGSMRLAADGSLRLAEDGSMRVAEEGSTRKIDSSTLDFQTISSIVVTKDGVDVAHVTQHLPATSSLNSPDVHVTGSLQGQGIEKGHLEVTFEHPTYQQAGNYKCDVTSVDSLGKSYKFSKTLDIIEDEVTLADLVNQMSILMKDKEVLEKTVSEMSQENSQMNQTVEKMTQTINSISKINKDQTKEILALQQTCEDLGTKANSSSPQVFFSVALSRQHNNQGQTVIYDRTWSNVGGAFDVSRGMFTCTMAGYYSFVVNLESADNEHGSLWLELNGQRVFRVFAYTGWQSATNSAILKLNIGDTVKTVNDGFTAHSNSREFTTNFSGHLVAVV